MIPLINRTQKSFEHWLGDAYAHPFTIDYDVDRIEALADERAVEWTRIGAATFLTDDEKREALGYGKKGVPVAPMVQNYAPDQPRDDHGRWSGGGGQGDGGSGSQIVADKPRPPDDRPRHPPSAQAIRARAHQR